MQEAQTYVKRVHKVFPKSISVMRVVNDQLWCVDDSGAIYVLNNQLQEVGIRRFNDIDRKRVKRYNDVAPLGSDGAILATDCGLYEVGVDGK